MKNLHPLFFLRLLIAGIFIISGTEKLLTPYENFLYVIQNYRVMPWAWSEELVAQVFPWLELFLGVFLFLGLWTRGALAGVAGMSTTFIIVVGQAIIRALPIHSCGCFGDLVKVPLPVIIAMDTMILAGTVLMLRHETQTRVWSLDAFFEKDR